MPTRSEIHSFFLCLGGIRTSGRKEPIYIGVPGIPQPITFGGQWERRRLSFPEVRAWLVNNGADAGRVDECWDRHIAS